MNALQYRPITLYIKMGNILRMRSVCAMTNGILKPGTRAANYLPRRHEVLVPVILRRRAEFVAICPKVTVNVKRSVSSNQCFSVLAYTFLSTDFA